MASETELLAACKWLIEQIEEYGLTDHSGESIEAYATKQARTAIARATGKED